MIKRYNKLVRDNIIASIKESNAIPYFHVASHKEYEESLWKKLDEEVNEFLESEDKEELADTLEVLLGLGKFYKLDMNSDKLRIQSSVKDHLKESSEAFIKYNGSNINRMIHNVYMKGALNGVSPEQLDYIRMKKLEERGGFERRIILDTVEYKNQ